jgi:hypothetical protein
VISRRAILLAGAGACFAAESSKQQVWPSEARRYNDPVTEFPLVCATSPDHTARLTAWYNRGLSRSFAVYASDRTGAFEVYRIDFKSFENRRLTSASKLAPDSVCLLPGDRTFAYADGSSLMLAPVGPGHAREIYTAAGDIASAAVSADGTQAAIVEKAGAGYRLVLAPVAKGEPRTLAESPEPLADPVHRERRVSVLYRRGAEWWLANYDGSQNYRLRIPADKVATPQWSPDGRSILYASIPADPQQKTFIREFFPDTNEDKPVASTSRYVAFDANSDASVFAGASASKASPHILLLLRSVRRELTICEHKASDPSMATPAFSPNSQRLLFASDQHGKPALYAMNIERLVEET